MNIGHLLIFAGVAAAAWIAIAARRRPKPVPAHLIRYTKLSDGSWGIIGPDDKMHRGWLRVHSKSGKKHNRRCISLEEPFPGRDGTMMRKGRVEPWPDRKA